MRRALLVVLALAATLAGCASHSTANQASHPPPVRPSITPTPSPPTTVRVQKMPNSYVHFPVASQDLRQIINVHGPELAAIANHGAFFGTTYPAISTNDGASWAISGPQLTRPGADGAHVTDRIGSTSNHTIVMWGSGGNFVETLPPGARYWYQSEFNMPVHRLSIKHQAISVTVDGGSATDVSIDDGLRWS
jgi:hypothetical protein